MRRNDLVAGIYIGALVALAAIVTAVSMKEVLTPNHGERILAWTGMAVLTLLLGRLAVRLPMRQFRVSMSDVFLFATAVIFGPALATLNGALDGYAASARAHGAWYKRLFNTASMALSMNLSSWLFVKMSPAHGPVSMAHSALEYMLPLVVMAGAQYLLNTGFVAGVVALKEGLSFTAIWQDTTPWAGGSYLFGATSLGGIMMLVGQAGPVAFLALLPLPVILYFTYRSWIPGAARGKGGLAV